MTTADTQGAYPGIFITFEGGEGAGKTTHLNFLAKALREQGRDVVCLREPGGTSIGEDLRAVVLDAANTALCDETELLIYEAARAQLVREVIAPALERGQVVLCDRFCDSTVAYQAYGRGLSRAFVKTANEFACQGVWPNRTILLTAGDADESVETGLLRATKHGTADRLEQAGLAFHANVNRGFLEIAEENPERIRVVSSLTPKPETARSIFSAVADVFGWDDLDTSFPAEFFEQVAVKHADHKAVVDQSANAIGAV